MEQGQTEEAASTARKAAALAPKMHSADLKLGHAYLQDGTIGSRATRTREGNVPRTRKRRRALSTGQAV